MMPPCPRRRYNPIKTYRQWPEPLRYCLYQRIVSKVKALIRQSKTVLTGFIFRLKAQGHTVEAVEFHLPLLAWCLVIMCLLRAEASSKPGPLFRSAIRLPQPECNRTWKAHLKNRAAKASVLKYNAALCWVLLCFHRTFYDAYYTKAQQVRRIIRDKTLAFFDQYDLVILPTTPTGAFEIGAKSENPIAMYLPPIFLPYRLTWRATRPFPYLLVKTPTICHSAYS